MKTSGLIESEGMCGRSHLAGICPMGSVRQARIAGLGNESARSLSPKKKKAARKGGFSTEGSGVFSRGRCVDSRSVPSREAEGREVRASSVSSTSHSLGRVIPPTIRFHALSFADAVIRRGAVQAGVEVEMGLVARLAGTEDRGEIAA